MGLQHFVFAFKQATRESCVVAMYRDTRSGSMIESKTLSQHVSVNMHMSSS